MIPAPIRNYFDGMLLDQILKVDRAQNPAALIQAGKEYIDEGGNIQFNENYSLIKKVKPFPLNEPPVISIILTFYQEVN